MQYLDTYNSPLGKILLASEDDGLIGLWFYGQKYFKSNILKNAEEKSLPIFILTKKWLDIYFSGKKPSFTPPLNFKYASSFQKNVLNALLKIPYGTITTYKNIALEIEKITKKKTSYQAVGRAVGHNPISIIIPCHRVVGKDKSLKGYAGGVDKKLKLLKLENCNLYQIKF